MIGRHDITFRSESAYQVMEGANRLLRVSWDEAIVEDAETGELLHPYSEVVVGLPVELLIYKNASAQASWKAYGAIAENKNLMVHVLRGDESITIVIDDPHAVEMSLMVAAIRNYVYQDIFWMRADAA